MKIRVEDFVEGRGVKFTIEAQTEPERVLLYACVASEALSEGDEEAEFTLVLPVSN